jgi:hypothetical protein
MAVKQFNNDSIDTHINHLKTIILIETCNGMYNKNKYRAYKQGGNRTFIVERVELSPQLPCPSPLVRVQSFADSLKSVSLHAHIYKNTVKRLGSHNLIYHGREKYQQGT